MSLKPDNKMPNYDFQTYEFQIGETIKVKKGIMCPDYEGLCLENYQGLVTDFGEDEDGNQTICIEWDSTSLKSLPEYYISESIQDGLAYQLMYLYADEIEHAEPRNTEEEGMALQDALYEKYKWAGFEGADKIVIEVIENIDPEDDMLLFNTWKTYLEKNLVLPLSTKIAKYQPKGKLKQGDLMKVLEIVFVDEKHGIIVEAKKGNNRYSIPLCDLEVTDSKNISSKPLHAYTMWFSNR